MCYRAAAAILPMDLTPLTLAHILVILVVSVGILSGLGLYQP